MADIMMDTIMLYTDTIMLPSRSIKFKRYSINSVKSVRGGKKCRPFRKREKKQFKN